MISIFQDEAEYVSKVSNTVLNFIGILALIIGIAEIQQLKPLLEEEVDAEEGYDLDTVLLRFTSFFSFIYMIFTIITGAFNTDVDDFPNELQHTCVQPFEPQNGP